MPPCYTLPPGHSHLHSVQEDHGWKERGGLFWGWGEVGSRFLQTPGVPRGCRKLSTN